MELSVFVKETIVQIVEGINQANDHFISNKVDAKANPANVYPTNNETQVYGFVHKSKDITNNRYVHKVNFDVAVYAAEGKETKGGIGIMVASVGLGAHGKSDIKNSSESKIQFDIPVMFPEK